MKINGSHIHFIDIESKKPSVIVMLHGWGQNVEMMKPLICFFRKNHRVVLIDLPGHGGSEAPPFDYSIYDYALVLNQLFQKLKITNPIIIGHSFGGKIALLYASAFSVKKLIVLSSPFRKSKKNDSLKIKTLKFLKEVPFLKPFEEFAKKRIGTSEYRQASPVMRKVFVNFINFDLTNDISKITAPTLLVWGNKDQVVPLAEGKMLAKQLTNAKLVVIEAGSHYAYLEQLSYVIKIINWFIVQEKNNTDD